MEKKNLFDLYPFKDTLSEQFETLLSGGSLDVPGGFRLERIVSFGRATPAGEWYEQQWSEWVAVTKGMAILMYEDGTSVTMRSGDYLVIHPRVRHRVQYTSEDCHWLAFHFRED